MGINFMILILMKMCILLRKVNLFALDLYVDYSYLFDELTSLKEETEIENINIIYNYCLILYIEINKNKIIHN